MILMAQSELYFKTLQESKIALNPDQINGNIDSHLFNNLVTKIEGKTNENGIILKIIKIVEYNYGIINKLNFLATVDYNIKYEALLCAPVKDLEIICIIDNIVKGFLIGHNGPIIIAIQFNNMDIQKFEINGNNINYKKTNLPINKGDYIKVSIINVSSNLGEREIVAVCKLLNLASAEEIEKFNSEQSLTQNNITSDEYI